MAGCSRMVVGWEKEGNHWDRKRKIISWKLCLLVGNSAAWMDACLQALALLWLECVPAGVLPRAVTSLMVREVGGWLYSGGRKVWRQRNSQLSMSSMEIG